jgi:integrase
VLVTAPAAGRTPPVAGAGDHDPGQFADGLWQEVPAGLRLSRFCPATVPDQYRGAFTNSTAWRAGIDLSHLPGPMQRELAWCMFRVIGLGWKISTPALSMLARRLGEVIAGLSGHQAPVSLTGLPADAWLREILLAKHRSTGQLPRDTSCVRHLRGMLRRFQRLLAAAADERPWWQRELWIPAEDARIPVRQHEPRRKDMLNFGRITLPWLRSGLQWHCKTALETGTLTWTTLLGRVQAVVVFDTFLAGRETCGPQLAGDPGQLRVLMLEFLGHLKARRSTSGPTIGQPVSGSHVKQTAGAIEQFYRFMHDNKDAAAAALGEPGWLRLGPEHARFFRRGELPRVRLSDPDAQVIGDAAMSKIMAEIGVLGAPGAQGGFGDEQGMRIMMLQVRLGRRINELCLLDRDPQLPLTPSGAAASGDPDAFTAKLRYQQTKIDGAPGTVPVDAEVAAIIRAQQEWADRWLAGHAAPGTRPGYLFLGLHGNRNGDKCYSHHTLRRHLHVLARRLDIRDAAGRLVDFNRTHRFRHTRATSLINAGVPLHVVQRYLGHLSPTMTMHYAKTLAETAEAEFLRFRKLTADARPVQADPRDLYDMLQLDARTDRILPNGWCLLPPRQSCDRGNACLTCDKFATDATFLPELQQQKDRTLHLIGQRQQAFTARTGTPMGEDNIWLHGRRRELASLEAIITTLQHQPGTTGAASAAIQHDPAAGHQAIRGAGVTARTDQIAARAARPSPDRAPA